MNDLKPSQVADVEIIVTPSEEKSSGKRSSRSGIVFKIIVGFLALIGLAVIAVIFYAVIAAKQEPPVSQSIDEISAVERVMEHAYGKYSASKRGWTYVSDDGDTYLVTVVHQKKIEAVGKGDELYLVTSGTKIASGASDSGDDDQQTLYGVFKVTARNDELFPVSRPVNFGGTVKLSPERVKFIVLNEDYWGWVLKHEYESDGLATTFNEVLVAGDEEIHEAGQFVSAYDNTKEVIATHGSCALANAAYAQWKERAALRNASANPEEKPAEVEQMENEPQRCTKYAITFRTDPVTEKFFTALHLTRTGVKDGQPIDQKKWKVMFDQKSFTYMLPKELEEEYESFARPD